MSGIIILGGTGYTGKLIAGHLLKCSETFVTIASRHLDQAQAFADELNRQYSSLRATAVYADAADAVSLRATFQGHDLVLVAAPVVAYMENVIRAALETGIDYLDVQLSAAKFALLQSLAGQIEKAGLCFITESGFHPGLPSALVRFAAAHLDTIENAITAGYLNMGKDLPYSEAVDELIDAFRNYQAQVFQDGRWTEPDSFKTRRIDFGSDIGLKTCYSMFFEELSPLPEIYSSLKNTGFYMSQTHWAVDYIVFPLSWVCLKLGMGSDRAIGKFLWWGMRNFHKPPYRVELLVQASGFKNKQPVKIQASVSHPDGYELTAIPVVAALLQYLDGSARRPGLHMMGYFVEPLRLLKDMQKMGVLFESGIY